MALTPLKAAGIFCASLAAMAATSHWLGAGRATAHGEGTVGLASVTVPHSMVTPALLACIEADHKLLHEARLKGTLDVVAAQGGFSDDLRAVAQDVQWPLSETIETYSMLRWNVAHEVKPWMIKADLVQSHAEFLSGLEAHFAKLRDAAAALVQSRGVDSLHASEVALIDALASEVLSLASLGSKIPTDVTARLSKEVEQFLMISAAHARIPYGDMKSLMEAAVIDLLQRPEQCGPLSDLVGIQDPDRPTAG